MQTQGIIITFWVEQKGIDHLMSIWLQIFVATTLSNAKRAVKTCQKHSQTFSMGVFKRVFDLLIKGNALLSYQNQLTELGLCFRRT